MLPTPFSKAEIQLKDSAHSNYAGRYFLLQSLRIVIGVAIVSFVAKLGRLVPPIENLTFAELLKGFLVQMLDPTSRLSWMILATALGVLLAGKLLQLGYSARRVLIIHLAVAACCWGVLNLTEYFVLSSSRAPTTDFQIYKVAENLQLLGLFYLGAFSTTYFYWKRSSAPTIEMALLAAILVWLLSGHQNFQTDAPKELSSVAWYLALEPHLLLLGVGLGFCIFLGSYLVASHERPLFGGRELILSSGSGRRLTTFLTPAAIFLILLGLATYLNSRYQRDLGMFGEGVGMGQSGEGESPLTFSSAVGKTRQLAALLRFENDYPNNPNAPMLYLREGALSKYNGKEIVNGPAIFDDDVPRIRPDQPYVAPEKRQGVSPDTRKEVTTSVYLLSKHQTPFTIDFPVTIRGIKNPDPERFISAYQATSLAPVNNLQSLIGEEVGEADWSKEKLAHYLEAPGSKGGEKAKPEDANSETPILDKYGEDLRYGLYEQKLIGQGTSPISPIVKARTIVDHLSKTSVYTRAPEHKLPTNGDPVAPYLFSEKKRGYCVHFAHAAVYLLRLAGIPSRIGTGYLTDLSYAKDGHVLLHIGDRHAWPEIYVRGQGWLPIDIQPAEAENEQEIIPDEKLLEELMSKIDPAELLAGTPPTAPEDLEQPRLIERIVSGRVALGALMATLSLLLIAKCWLRYAWLFPARVELRTQRAYRSFASYVADLGLLRNIGETRQEFAKRVQSIFEIKATALTNLNEARVYSTRFDNKSMLELLRAIEEVQDSPTNGKQRIRRILGFFNPLSLTRLGRW